MQWLWKNKNTILKFLISGSTAAFVDMGLIYLFTDTFGIWYLYSSFLAFILAFCVSFTLQKFWAFSSKDLSLVKKQSVLYLTVAVINLLLNALALYVLVDIFQLWYLFAQVLILGVIAASNFFIYRFVIFPNTNERPHDVRVLFKSVLHSHYFFLYCLASINLLVAYFYVKEPFQPGGDSQVYLHALEYLLGQDVAMDGRIYSRLLTGPLMLYLSIFLSFFTRSLYGGMIFLNLVFYFSIIPFFYKLVIELYNDTRVALFASILFISNFGFYNFGPAYLADMPSWFFFIVSLWAGVRFYKSHNNRFFYSSILASSIGFLFKEYGGIGIIALGIFIIMMRMPLLAKFKRLFIACSLFLLPTLCFQALYYFQLHYTYLDWYGYNIYEYFYKPSEAKRYSVVILIKVLGWLYLLGWPIFLLGCFREWKERNRERIKILIALLIPSLAFLAWPALMFRTAFILVPWLTLLSGYGLASVKNKAALIAIILVYIIVDYLKVPFLIPTINISW